MMASYSPSMVDAPSASGIASPRSVVFAYNPVSFSCRSTAMHESVSLRPRTACTRCACRGSAPSAEAASPAARRIAPRGRVETDVLRSVNGAETIRLARGVICFPVALSIRVSSRTTDLVREGVGRRRDPASVERGIGGMASTERAALAAEHLAPQPFGIVREHVVRERGLHDPGALRELPVELAGAPAGVAGIPRARRSSPIASGSTSDGRNPTESTRDSAASVSTKSARTTTAEVAPGRRHGPRRRRWRWAASSGSASSTGVSDGAERRRARLPPNARRRSPPSARSSGRAAQDRGRAGGL